MSELPSVSTLRTVGEHVELELGEDLAASPRYNDDIAPTRAEQRTWTKWNVASLWVGMAICVPTYTLGGVLTAYFGLSVSEALWTILIANIVVLIPLTLNAFPGTRYGIPCPVVLRASFGIIGSNLPSLIRAIVACGWFGVQTLFGGIAIHLMLAAMFDSWAALGGTGEVIGFFIFWAANITVVLRGSESIKHLETLAAPLLLLVALGLMFWALPKISLPELLSVPAGRPDDAAFAPYFMAALTAMVGFWATLSLNIPDFSRYARSQRAQVVGQIIGLPLTVAAVVRALWLRYRITNRRVSVTGGWMGQDRTDIVYSEIVKVAKVPRGFGAWGDLVITLRNGTRLELRALPRFREIEAYITEKMKAKTQKADSATN